MLRAESQMRKRLTSGNSRSNYLGVNETALSFANVREGTRQVMAQFLRAELGAAQVLCSLVKLHQQSGFVADRIRLTQAAVDTIRRFMWTVKLEPQELNQITAQLELLHFELESVQRDLPVFDGEAESLTV